MNQSNMLKGVFLIIEIIIRGTNTQSMLFSLCDTHYVTTINETSRSNRRISKTPFTKWYIKGYVSQSKYVRIIKYLIENDLMSGNLLKNKTIDELISLDNT